MGTRFLLLPFLFVLSFQIPLRNRCFFISNYETEELISNSLVDPTILSLAPKGDFQRKNLFCDEQNNDNSTYQIYPFQSPLYNIFQNENNSAIKTRLDTKLTISNSNNKSYKITNENNLALSIKDNQLVWEEPDNNSCSQGWILIDAPFNLDWNKICGLFFSVDTKKFIKFNKNEYFPLELSTEIEDSSEVCMTFTKRNMYLLESALDHNEVIDLNVDVDSKKSVTDAIVLQWAKNELLSQYFVIGYTNLSEKNGNPVVNLISVLGTEIATSPNGIILDTQSMSSISNSMNFVFFRTK